MAGIARIGAVGLARAFKLWGPVSRIARTGAAGIARIEAVGRAKTVKLWGPVLIRVVLLGVVLFGVMGRGRGFGVATA